MSDFLVCPPVQILDIGLPVIPLDEFQGRLLAEREKHPDSGAIDMVEQVMLDLPQIDLPLKHIFSPGIYAREMTVPAGVLLTGKVHKHKHLVILSQGDISFYTDGKFVQRVAAPATFVSEAGDRRMGYTHAQTVWTTVHATSETDIDKLEADLFESSEIEAQLKPKRITWQRS